MEPEREEQDAGETSQTSTPSNPPRRSTEFYAIYVPKSPDRHVFSKLAEVRKFLSSDQGKIEGTRFKKCVDDEEVDAFFTERSAEEESMGPSSSSRSIEPVSPYKSPPIARSTELRKAIESKDDKRFEELLEENPGFLINTNNDRPNIIQAGFHYNALHVACRSSNHYAVKRILELVSDSSWLTRVYGTDSCAEERSTYLLDAFLNTPDMAENNTPLHYACKFGSLPIVTELLKHSVCRRKPKNKYDETPLDMLCRGFKGPPADKSDLTEKLAVRLSSLRIGKSSQETSDEKETRDPVEPAAPQTGATGGAEDVKPANGEPQKTDQADEGRTAPAARKKPYDVHGETCCAIV